MTFRTTERKATYGYVPKVGDMVRVRNVYNQNSTDAPITVIPSMRDLVGEVLQSKPSPSRGFPCGDVLVHIIKWGTYFVFADELEPM